MSSVRPAFTRAAATPGGQPAGQWLRTASHSDRRCPNVGLTFPSQGNFSKHFILKRQAGSTWRRILRCLCSGILIQNSPVDLSRLVDLQLARSCLNNLEVFLDEVAEHE